MMHADQDRPVAACVELCLEPGEASGAQTSAARAGIERVERDHADLARVESELHEISVALDFGTIGEHGAQIAAIVVVADEQMPRDREPLEQRVQMPVFVDAACIDEIARDEHGVGARLERIERVDRLDEKGGRVDSAIGERARR